MIEREEIKPRSRCWKSASPRLRRSNGYQANPAIKAMARTVTKASGSQGGGNHNP
jgi:hypothetical protein